MLYLTDPTYLRYIVDGLHNQSIQQENLAALPQGLIGIYEEALPWEHNLQERGRFLQFFSVWALLKKEVSAILVSSLLKWPEQEVIDALATHTKWFNSPASGTYILYHERLRAYLLAKITSDQLNKTNQKIIESCQHALELKKGDEWEIYALEHISLHLTYEAFRTEDATKLKCVSYNKHLQKRQVEISNSFEWSKKMLNDMMLWASKFNDDDTIECALNKVELYHLEQNDAKGIIEFLVNDCIESVLDRIETFGGNDEEGLRRKFILYMLSLMELTFFTTKNLDFQKSAIEKLMLHIIVNKNFESECWSIYFDPSIVFEMAIEWHHMDIDYKKLYELRSNWDWEISIFQSAFQTDKVNVLKEIFPIMFDNIRNHVDKNWIFGSAVYFLGLEWVNKTLELDSNSYELNDYASIHYFIANELYTELENYFKNILDNEERLLIAYLNCAELLSFKKAHLINRYLFDIGELFDYFLSSNNKLYTFSLVDNLFRYILLLLEAGDAFSIDMAHQYFIEFIKINDSIEFYSIKNKIYSLLQEYVIIFKLGLNKNLILKEIKEVGKKSDIFSSADTILIYFSDIFKGSVSEYSNLNKILKEKDLEELLHFVALHVKINYHEKFEMERYSYSISSINDFKHLKQSLISSLAYKGISCNDKLYFDSSLAIEFKEFCNESFNYRNQKQSIEEQTSLIDTEKGESKELGESSQMQDLFNKNSQNLDWNRQWKKLKSLNRSDDRFDFLNSLYVICNDLDVLDLINLHIRYYKLTKGNLVKKHLYFRVFEFFGKNRWSEILGVDNQKWISLSNVLIFLIEESSIVNKENYSDYKTNVSGLFSISFKIINNIFLKNRSISDHFIKLLCNYLSNLDIQTANPDNIIFLHNEINDLYNCLKGDFSRFIGELSSNHEIYASNFTYDDDSNLIYSYFYLIAFFQLKNEKLNEFQQSLNFIYENSKKEIRLKLDKQVYRDIGTVIYVIVNNSNSEKISRYFNFSFSNFDLNYYFKSNIIENISFKIDKNLLLSFIKWKDISSRNIEFSLLCFFVKKLINEEPNYVLSVCGQSLDIQWAIDIKKSFSDI